MITGELKSQIDRIWDAFWSGGISNPLEVIEQITYLLFLRRLDDLHTLERRDACLAPLRIAVYRCISQRAGGAVHVGPGGTIGGGARPGQGDCGCGLKTLSSVGPLSGDLL
jgi:hypothetical protein